MERENLAIMIYRDVVAYEPCGFGRFDGFVVGILIKYGQLQLKLEAIMWWN